MRIDPVSVFTHSVATMPGRIVALWFMVYVGALVPMHMGGDYRGDPRELPGEFLVYFIFLPFKLVISTFSSVVGVVVSLPSLVMLLWRCWLCLVDDVALSDFEWIFPLAFLAALGAVGELWPVAGIILVIVCVTWVGIRRLRSRGYI